MLRAVLVGVGIFMCGVLPAQTVVRVGGGTAIQAIFEPLKPHLERDRNIRLELSDKGPDASFVDLEAGKLDAAVAGTSMEGWLEMMKSKGHPTRPILEYKHIQIGEDRLSVLINPDVVTDMDVLLMELGKEKIKGLFTGKFKNWKDVGGPDMPVVVVLGKKTAGANREFQAKALDGQPFTKDVMEVGTVPEIIQVLITTKGAIGLGPFAVTNNTKIWSPSQAPQVVRPFTLLVRGDMTPEMKKTLASMVEYILGPGKKYLSQ